ncbi:short-chain dehydrogenase [Rhizodiscina lignyota]|uniref:Short-chain dehydrogenase n=1 Tax=Rhizodiscina lignyota TaxID=1504668 RepID=A0A9P4I8J3_9PEZI|nr:short-chain dehydrogenase [Rhizodiscina lignyota]
MAQESIIAPYAEVHRPENLRGAGDGRPTAIQIIEDEHLINKWSDKTVLITGGSSGIGVETARALHATGARVFITTRDNAKAESVAADILANSPSKVPIEIVFMELGSLDSVKAGVEDFRSRSDKLNILINNAGIMAAPHGHTKDGFELQFGTNHLSHFLLTKLLLPTLIASSTPEFASRIVNLSSNGHLYHNKGGLTPEVFADLDFKQTPYNEWAAYGRSKTANILHANRLERLYGSSPDHPVHAFSLHPGGITTALWRHQGDMVATRLQGFASIWKSPEQGAATSVWCAVAKVWEGKAGRYCENCQESVPVQENPKMGDPGYGPWAKDPVAEQKLWEMSEEMVAPWLK